MAPMLERASRVHVHAFGTGISGSDAAGGAPLRTLWGPRGSRLVRLAQEGWPLLPGFIISTDVCAYAARHEGELPPALGAQLKEAWSHLRLPGENADHRMPVLADVSCDAGLSPDDLFPTVLGLGYSKARHSRIAAHAGGEDRAYQAGSLLLDTLGGVLWGPRWSGFVARAGTSPRERYLRLEELWTKRQGAPPPADPLEQLRLILQSVCASWNQSNGNHRKNRGSKTARLGPAVIVQLWLPGTGAPDGGWGRIVSRNPETGQPKPAGIFFPAAFPGLPPATAESALRLDALLRHRHAALRRIGREALGWADRLEREQKYPSEIEFVADGGRCWIRKADAAQAGTAAVLRWVCDMTSDRPAGRRGSKPLTPPEALPLLSPSVLAAAFMRVYGSGRRGSGAPAKGAPAVARERDMCRKISEWIAPHQRIAVLAAAHGPDEIRFSRMAGASGFCLPPSGQPPEDPALVRSSTIKEAESAIRAYAKTASAEWEPWICAAHVREVRMTMRSSTPAPMAAALVRSLALALVAGRRHGYDVRGRVMMSGFSDWSEFEAPARLVQSVAASVQKETGVQVDLRPGAWIENPRAALLADRGAETAECLTFNLAALDRALRGTRTAAAEFDAEGLGALLEQSLRLIRRVRHDLPCGASGVPWADGSAMRFLQRLGFAYVCCATEDIPAARLAAAQAALFRMDQSAGT